MAQIREKMKLRSAEIIWGRMKVGFFDSQNVKTQNSASFQDVVWKFHTLIHRQVVFLIHSIYGKFSKVIE